MRNLKNKANEADNKLNEKEEELNLKVKSFEEKLLAVQNELCTMGTMSEEQVLVNKALRRILKQ